MLIQLLAVAYQPITSSLVQRLEMDFELGNQLELKGIENDFLKTPQEGMLYK